MLLSINENEYNDLIKKKLLEHISNNKYKLYCVNLLEYAKASSVKNFQLGSDSAIAIEVEVVINTTTKKSTQLKINDSNGHLNIEEWIDDWRSQWSGKRAKGMGNRQDCIDKMKEFFKNNSSYTKEDVFNARDLYFKDMIKQYGNYQYLKQADYFIKKKDKVTGEVTTDILIYCEQIKFNKDNNFENESKFTIFDDL